ncbi:MAG: 50S ribosomal protein L29 [Kiritimatiellota bacterium]|nr:50S ribosomal protein L29 [Kiritimatiellota bacterium]
MSKAKELRELAQDEREQKLQDRVKEAFDLQKVKATGKLDNPLQVRMIRREIARLRTMINEKMNVKETGNAGHGNTTRKA